MEVDPLEPFKRWEGEDLGEDWDLAPGWYGERRAPRPYVHFAGAWCMSTDLGDGTPGVYLRLVAGAAGTGPRYHVMDAVVDASIATEWAHAMLEAARRAGLDIEAGGPRP